VEPCSRKPLQQPQKLRITDPAVSGRFALQLTEEIPPIPQPADTKYVKHIRIQSERLSKFWDDPLSGRACAAPEVSIHIRRRVIH